jgi:hypothetical protein
MGTYLRPRWCWAHAKTPKKRACPGGVRKSSDLRAEVRKTRHLVALSACEGSAEAGMTDGRAGDVRPPRRGQKDVSIHLTVWPTHALSIPAGHPRTM